MGELRRDPVNSFPSAYINADDIEKEFAQTSSLSKVELERLAFKEARSLRALYRESLTSHAFETVFSHASNLLDMFRLQEDFEIELYCVSTDRPELNVARVRLRVACRGLARRVGAICWSSLHSSTNGRPRKWLCNLLPRFHLAGL